MVPYYILSGITLFGLFILFLVLGKTLNGIINQLLKIEFMLQKECEFRKEEKEIQLMMEKNLVESRGVDDEEEEEEE